VHFYTDEEIAERHATIEDYDRRASELRERLVAARTAEIEAREAECASQQKAKQGVASKSRSASTKKKQSGKGDEGRDTVAAGGGHELSQMDDGLVSVTGEEQDAPLLPYSQLELEQAVVQELGGRPLELETPQLVWAKSSVGFGPVSSQAVANNGESDHSSKGTFDEGAPPPQGEAPEEASGDAPSGQLRGKRILGLLDPVVLRLDGKKFDPEAFTRLREQEFLASIANEIHTEVTAELDSERAALQSEADEKKGKKRPSSRPASKGGKRNDAPAGSSAEQTTERPPDLLDEAVYSSELENRVAAKTGARLAAWRSTFRAEDQLLRIQRTEALGLAFTVPPLSLIRLRIVHAPGLCRACLTATLNGSITTEFPTIDKNDLDLPEYERATQRPMRLLLEAETMTSQLYLPSNEVHLQTCFYGRHYNTDFEIRRQDPKAAGQQVFIDIPEAVKGFCTVNFPVSFFCEESFRPRLRFCVESKRALLEVSKTSRLGRPDPTDTSLAETNAGSLPGGEFGTKTLRPRRTTTEPWANILITRREEYVPTCPGVILGRDMRQLRDQLTTLAGQATQLGQQVKETEGDLQRAQEALQALDAELAAEEAAAAASGKKSQKQPAKKGKQDPAQERENLQKEVTRLEESLSTLLTELSALKDQGEATQAQIAGQPSVGGYLRLEFNIRIRADDQPEYLYLRVRAYLTTLDLQVRYPTNSAGGCSLGQILMYHRTNLPVLVRNDSCLCRHICISARPTADLDIRSGPENGVFLLYPGQERLAWISLNPSASHHFSTICTVEDEFGYTKSWKVSGAAIQGSVACIQEPKLTDVALGDTVSMAGITLKSTVKTKVKWSVSPAFLSFLTVTLGEILSVKPTTGILGPGESVKLILTIDASHEAVLKLNDYLEDLYSDERVCPRERLSELCGEGSHDLTSGTILGQSLTVVKESPMEEGGPETMSGPQKSVAGSGGAADSTASAGSAGARRTSDTAKATTNQLTKPRPSGARPPTPMKTILPGASSETSPATAGRQAVSEASAVAGTTGFQQAQGSLGQVGQTVPVLSPCYGEPREPQVVSFRTKRGQFLYVERRTPYVSEAELEEEGASPRAGDMQDLRPLQEGQEGQEGPFSGSAGGTPPSGTRDVSPAPLGLDSHAQDQVPPGPKEDDTFANIHVTFNIPIITETQDEPAFVIPVPLIFVRPLVTATIVQTADEGVEELANGSHTAPPAAPATASAAPATQQAKKKGKEEPAPAPPEESSGSKARSELETARALALPGLMESYASRLEVQFGKVPIGGLERRQATLLFRGELNIRDDDQAQEAGGADDEVYARLRQISVPYYDADITMTSVVDQARLYPGRPMTLRFEFAPRRGGAHSETVIVGAVRSNDGKRLNNVVFDLMGEGIDVDLGVEVRPSADSEGLVHDSGCAFPPAEAEARNTSYCEFSPTSLSVGLPPVSLFLLLTNKISSTFDFQLVAQGASSLCLGLQKSKGSLSPSEQAICRVDVSVISQTAPDGDCFSVVVGAGNFERRLLGRVFARPEPIWLALPSPETIRVSGNEASLFCACARGEAAGSFTVAKLDDVLKTLTISPASGSVQPGTLGRILLRRERDSGGVGAQIEGSMTLKLCSGGYVAYTTVHVILE